MNERLQKLFDALKGEYELGTFKEFSAYLADDKKRKLFYEEIIAPNFDVESLDIFEQAYGLKKKRRYRGYWGRNGYGISWTRGSRRWYFGCFRSHGTTK